MNENKMPETDYCKIHVLTAVSYSSDRLFHTTKKRIRKFKLQTLGKKNKMISLQTPQLMS